MSQSFDISVLLREARSRWLKPSEVCHILQNHDMFQITPEPPKKPPSGSLFLYNRRLNRFFRKDGYAWRRKKRGRTIVEAYVRLKVGNVDALSCCYAHVERNPCFQRRCFWMLEPAYNHIVLVQYRDVAEGRYYSAPLSNGTTGSLSTLSYPNDIYHGSTSGNSEGSESYHSYSNMSTITEVSSWSANEDCNNDSGILLSIPELEQIAMGAPELGQTSLEQSSEFCLTDNDNSTNKSGLDQALKKIAEQSSLGDDDDDYIYENQAQPLGFVTNIEAADRQGNHSSNSLGKVSGHNQVNPIRGERTQNGVGRGISPSWENVLQSSSGSPASSTYQSDAHYQQSSEYQPPGDLDISDLQLQLSAAKRFLQLSNGQFCDKEAGSIQKKYRGWKGRRNFLNVRRHVVKIQAHVRGHQARKKYKTFISPVNVLEKVILRWRWKGHGLHGFRAEQPAMIEAGEEEKEDDNDFDDDEAVKIFRRQKVDESVKEAVSRVLSMVDSPEARMQYHQMLEEFRQATRDMELGPISASLGAMGSLSWKLDELLATRHRALRGVVMDEIEELRTELHILHNLLLKLSNEQDPPPTARYWMKDVRDLSYDVEDCADQFIHADARGKIRRATRRKTITRLRISCLPERRKWRPWITNKVSDFRTQAQEAIQGYWRYKFDDCASNPGYSRIGHELPTLYTEPGDLVGMEGPMNELERWLTNGEEQLKVVSIVGVGGVGKTTLAQKLWGKLQGQFDCWAFVRTAQKPDMRGILRSILSQVRRHEPPGPGEMHHLIHELRQYLQAKRYFVIIDDLWATSVWDVVSRAFPEGNCCSRIITTTEIMEVALACCGYSDEHIFKMEPLSDSDSEKLLLQRILVSGNQSPQNFDDVLSQITRKCGGLPLAIIIVGSLLASQPDLDQWGFAQNSFGSNLQANPTMEGFMGQILNISFNSLPHYLKTCLLYLSTYPEGYIFLKDDLVKQWVAESFICAKEEEDMEEVAGSYFDELVSTGLIQVGINYNYELLSYSVHHMVLDLITYKSIEENFITTVDYSQTTTPLTDKVRRLSLHFGSATYATIPASTRLSQVRSLFFFGLFNCMPSFVVFKLLRVLNLHFWGDLENTIFNLTEVCELFQLRYLQVTSNVTVKLPDQIEAMKHLETLEINARVCAVPPDIVRLPSLLHLCLRGGTYLPDGIGCMRSLRTLKYFDVGNNSEDNLRGLGELTNLRGLHLTYSTLPSSEDLKRNLIALASSLGKLGNLKSLTLTPGTAGTVVLIDGLDGMSNLVFLERLELLPPICIFSRLPIWFAQLGKICIIKVAVRELPRDDIDILAGLPSLTVLSLCVQTAPEGRIVFNDGAFPVLKYFKFSCGVLCMSFMSGAMPNLRRLKLCFNTHIGEKYNNLLAGIEHLLNLQDITGQIGEGTESDSRAAESAIKDVISKHPRCPKFNVQLVDPIEEEYPSEKQHGMQEKGSSGEKHGILEKAEDTNKHEDSWLSQLPDLP